MCVVRLPSVMLSASRSSVKDSSGEAGEQGHDRQPPFLVNNTIELKKWFRVHGSSLRGSVK